MSAAREHIESAVAAYNAGDVERLLDGYADAAVEVTPQGSFTGRDAIAERLRTEFGAFPGKQIAPVHWTEDADTVVLEYQWTGTHSGPLRLPGGTEVPPTGEHLTFPVVSVFRVVNARTAEHRMYSDMLPPMMQLGLVAPTA